jgi:hypothetical protein
MVSLVVMCWDCLMMKMQCDLTEFVDDNEDEEKDR